MRRSATNRRPAVAASLLASLVLALACASPATALKAPRPAKPPAASTGGVLHASDSSAALNGTVNPRGTETSYYFQYGPTTAYGAQTPTTAVGAGTMGVEVSQPISGLQLGTVYHFRLVASSAAGTTIGQDHTFTTKQIRLKFVITNMPKVDVFGSPFSLAGILTGTGGAGQQVILQASSFPYLGGFADIGKPETTEAAGGFSFLVPSLPQTTRLRVGTLGALPSYSQVVTVHVAVLVTLHVHPTQKQGFVRLEGTVSPAAVGAPVVFQRVRPGRGPVDVGNATVRRGTAAGSRFSAVVSIRHAGDYRALVKVTNGKQVSGDSRTVFVDAPSVRPRKQKTHRAYARRRG
jgi:hypothetical protein